MASRCFMIQPFDGDKFDKRFDDVFAPAVGDAGLEPYRVDRDPGVAVPIEDIERGIHEAAACFVDVTLDNPNVWFELGYAIAARKDLCLVCSKERTTAFPFDIQHRKIIRYAPDAPRDFAQLGKSITARLKAILSQQEDRVTIQAITKESQTAGLSDYETAALASIASEANGINQPVSNWTVREEMEKIGLNRLACNVAVRSLLAKGFINSATGIDDFGNSYEAYTMDETGWQWITANIHTLNLSAKSHKTKASPFGKSSPFDKELDDEIPF